MQDTGLLSSCSGSLKNKGEGRSRLDIIENSLSRDYGYSTSSRIILLPSRVYSQSGLSRGHRCNNGFPQCCPRIHWIGQRRCLLMDILFIFLSWYSCPLDLVRNTHPSNCYLCDMYALRMLLLCLICQLCWLSLTWYEDSAAEWSR